jgi:hypothetical protein
MRFGGDLWNILFHVQHIILEVTYIAREIASSYAIERMSFLSSVSLVVFRPSRSILYVFSKVLKSSRSFAYSALKFLDSHDTVYSFGLSCASNMSYVDFSSDVRGVSSVPGSAPIRLVLA